MKKIFLTLTLVLFVIPFGMSQDLPSYVPTDGLVAYYPFNGNANDESGNGNDGVNSGAVLTIDRHGNSDSAFYFSGSSCSTRIDANVDMSSVLSSMSVSMWVNRNGNGCYNPRLFDFYDGGDNSNDWGEAWLNGENLFDISGYSDNDKWYNITIIVNPSENSRKYFINGNLVKNITFPKTLPLAGDFSIGRMNHPAYDAFNGIIDDFGIWNRALTEQEIQNLYTSSTGDIILNGVVSAENNQIKNVADPTEAQDAVTLSLLQTKLDELIERIEVLESDAKYDCGLAYFEDFSSCDLSGFNAQGGNITSTNSSFDGCGVYMTHYAGQDPNNFYATDKKFLYGVYELEAIADNGISDNIIRVLQQEELTGGYTFSLRPTGTDNPGWSVYNDGELVYSADTFPVARGNWYNVKIEVLKSSLKIWINDVVLFETDSITPPTDIPGYFKVGVAYSGGFDNLKFTPDSSLCK